MAFRARKVFGTFKKASFSTEFTVQYTEYCERKKFNLFTLEPLIESKVVRKRMAEKMADSGITLDHLQHAFKMGVNMGSHEHFVRPCKRKGYRWFAANL